jgi:hypothetical protein
MAAGSAGVGKVWQKEMGAEARLYAARVRKKL